MSNHTWVHGGFECWMEQDVEDDCIKNWHYYRADGVTNTMPLSPYVGEEAMRAWIDAGCPAHPRNGNFTLTDGKLVA
jgi:hypothetical protein